MQNTDAAGLCRYRYVTLYKIPFCLLVLAFNKLKETSRHDTNNFINGNVHNN